MDGERAVELDGQSELRAERRFLRDGVETLHPAVESHLADTGRGVSDKISPQRLGPTLRSRRHIPRMQAERDTVTRVAST